MLYRNRLSYGIIWAPFMATTLAKPLDSPPGACPQMTSCEPQPDSLFSSVRTDGATCSQPMVAGNWLLFMYGYLPTAKETVRCQQTTNRTSEVHTKDGIHVPVARTNCNHKLAIVVKIINSRGNSPLQVYQSTLVVDHGWWWGGVLTNSCQQLWWQVENAISWPQLSAIIWALFLTIFF